MEGRLLWGWQDFMERAVFAAVLAHTQTDEEVDLWHILAMCITPHVNRLEINLPAPYQEHSDAYPAVQKLYRLAECPTAAYFYIQDEQRKYLVQLLYQYWPKAYYHRFPNDPPSMAWQCAMAHLKASLGAWEQRQFANTHVAHVLARLEETWPQTWNTALTQLVSDEKIYYSSKNSEGNGGISYKPGKEQRWTLRGVPLYWERNQPRPLPPPSGSLHIIRGFVLVNILMEARGRDQYQSHMTVALNSMAEVLEWQLDNWTDDGIKKEAPVSDVTAVLLATTGVLFELIDASATREQCKEVYDNILHCCIQFLRHPNATVRHYASKVLQNGWSILGLPTAAFTSVLLTTFREIKSTEQRCEWKVIVAIVSRSSRPFAKEIAKILEGNLLQENTLIPVLTSNQPSTFEESGLNDALDKATSTKEILSMVAAIVAKRQSFYFDERPSGLENLWKYVDKVDSWDNYRMAIFALINGEYNYASHIFEKLSPMISDKHLYLWMEMLTKVAHGEGLLTKQAALGIRPAGVSLHDTLAYLDELQRQYKHLDFSFQIRFLLLRLDILDLVTVLRQILREMRLTLQLPAKGTRTYMYVPTILRCFLKLAKQFMDLDHRFGLLWESQRTPACLASFRDLAFFLAHTTKAAFAPILPTRLSKVTIPDLSSKLLFPMNSLLREFDKLVVRPIISSGSIDTKTLSAGLLQVLDGILMVPIPYPRDFCSALPFVELIWTVRPDSTHIAEMNQSSVDIVETFPLFAPTVCVKGFLRNVIKLQRSVRSIRLSYEIRYVEPLEEDSSSKDATMLPPISGETALDMDRQGQFCACLEVPPLNEEWWYILETFLQCQGGNGRTYSVAVSKEASSQIRIKNSRSR
jgi:hypothetical protein